MPQWPGWVWFLQAERHDVFLFLGILKKTLRFGKGN
jgi:hypothetical protein